MRPIIELDPPQLKSLIEEHFPAADYRLRRGLNGLLFLDLTAPEFNGEIDPQQAFEDKLKDLGYRLPERTILGVYSPDDLSETEPAVLFEDERIGLPTWGDALSQEPKKSMPSSTNFGENVTTVAFWGVKGGVGRTTTLAHVAAILNKKGKRILAVDLDLDSPALIAKLADPDLVEQTRFDKLVLTFQEEKDQQKRALAIQNTVIENHDFKNFRLHMLGQGFADEEFVRHLLGPLSPSVLYRGKESVLRDILSSAIQYTEAEIVFLDARSGFCDESAISLLDLADEVFLFVSAAPSNYPSIIPAITALERNRLTRGRPKLIHFVAAMLPAGQDARREAVSQLEETLKTAYDQIQQDLRLDQESMPADAPIIEIFYTPSIAENERTISPEVSSGFMEMAERICPPTGPTVGDIEAGLFQKIIKEIKVPDPQAEDGEIKDLVEIFTLTSSIENFADPRKRLVLGPKGSGKTYLKRLCLEKPELLTNLTGFRNTTFINGFGFLAIDGQKKFEIKGDPLLLQIHDRFPEKWSEAFAVISLASVFSEQVGSSMRSELPEQGRQDLQKLVQTQSRIEQFELIGRWVEQSLLLDDCWRGIGRWLTAQNRKITLIFDDLDTALGETADAIQERTKLVNGLFNCMNAFWWNQPLIETKIFLRNDLFNALNLEEEAKYKTRMVDLEWTPNDLWRLMVRAAAAGSPQYRDTIKKLGMNLELHDTILQESWDRALDLLWGERQGKYDSATRSKVWAARRLQDGKNRFFPRAALWLLKFAVEARKNREFRDEYALLDASSLRESMYEVARQRYKELLKECGPHEKDILQLLQGLPKAYMNKSDFFKHIEEKVKSSRVKSQARFTTDEAFKVLQELGVLEEGSRRDKTPTVRVVDLYALNRDLNITRMGRR